MNRWRTTEMVQVAAAMMLGQAQAGQTLPCAFESTVIQGAPCSLRGTPPATFIAAVNEAGMAAGWTQHCTLPNVNLPFVWSAEDGLVPIPLPANVTTATVAGINDDGMVCGTARLNTNVLRGFVWSNGVWTELPPANPLGWSWTEGINNAGQVVGARSLSSPGDPINPYNGYIWTSAGGFLDLGVLQGPNSSALHIAANGLAGGSTGDNTGAISDAFVRDGATISFLGPIPGGLTSRADVINSSGQVAGIGRLPIAGFPNGVNRAFHWQAGRFTMIDLLPGFQRHEVGAISDDGIVVGGCGLATSVLPENGFLWNGSTHDLNEFLSDPAIHIGAVKAITSDWRLVANGQVDGRSVGLLLTPLWALTADFNADCATDGIDLGILLSQWLAKGSADLNDDGIVNGIDLGILLANWNP